VSEGLTPPEKTAKLTLSSRSVSLGGGKTKESELIHG
jgi:hypothetical protein